MMKHYDAVLPAPTITLGSRTVSFAIGICCDGDEITEMHYLEAQQEQRERLAERLVVVAPGLTGALRDGRGDRCGRPATTGG